MEQSEFEVWFESTQRRNIEQFTAMERRRLMQMANYAWKASRDVIEIELNGDACHSDDYFNDGYRIATEAAEDAIASHGIKVKS